MSKSQSVTFRHKGFWASDVAVGIFLKHLIDAAQESAQADSEWLSRTLSDWRLYATNADFGLPFDEHWSFDQCSTVIAFAEKACTVLAKRDSIPAQEIISWPLADDIRIHPRGAEAVPTAGIVELGHAIIALLRNELPPAPKGEAWWFSPDSGRSTIRMDPSWDGKWSS